MTDLGAVIAQLTQERDKFDRAIAALSGGGGKSGRRTGKRAMSSAVRKRIVDAQRARWASSKRRSGPSK